MWHFGHQKGNHTFLKGGRPLSTSTPSTLNRIWRTSSLPAPLYNKYVYKAQQGLGIDASPFPNSSNWGFYPKSLYLT